MLSSRSTPEWLTLLDGVLLLVAGVAWVGVVVQAHLDADDSLF